MRAMAHQISVLALGAVLAVMPQAVAAQPRQTASQTQGLNDAAAQAIAPNLGDNTVLTTGDTNRDNGAQAVIQQDEAIGANPYTPFSYDNDVTYTQADGLRTNATNRRETPADRAGRYYGAAYSSGDLAAAAYSDDDYNSTRGKTTMKPRRLGVFDQGTVDKRRLAIRPYIEAAQVVQANLGSRSGLAYNDDVVTYSTIAAGADATINGRNNQGVISARYERRFTWNRKSNTDGVTGIARMSSSIVPNALRVDYGGFANRTYVSETGAAFGTSAVGADSLTQVYSLYAGPTLATQKGDVAMTAHYHAGYTSLNSQGNVTANGATAGVDRLDHSTVQEGRLAIGNRPGEGLPVGLGADAGIYQEDVSNLTQRVSDKHVRGSITIPVTEDVSLVGGAGYEHVRVSARNAKYDSAGNVIVDSNGRFVTDYSTGRQIAFDTEGLIWDAGVVWRPSRRTNVEFHVGDRYGRFGGYGFINYQPDDHSSFNLVVYQGVTGFGGALTNSLFNLPTQFSTVRDAITGNLSSCVAAATSGNCLAGSIGSVNSTVYRGNGFSAGYSFDHSRLRGGIGFGYERRQYITAPNTILANINGKVDQYYWVSTYLGYHVTPRSTFGATLDGYKYVSGINTAQGDINAVRAVALYQYYLSRHLTTTASLAMDGITREKAADLWSASAALGMRYTF